MEDLVSPRATCLLAVALVLPACAPEPPCGLRLCDIREPGCQREVGKATACLRGQPPAEVPIRVISQERFLAESVAAGEGGIDGDLFKRWMAGLGLFDLASPEVSVAEASREQAAWVAAFYDPGDKSVTIIDRGRPLDTRGAITLLVHEYTHALQDRTVGLETFRGRLANDLDRLLASKAVTEGEASLVEDLAALDLFGADESDIAWPRVFEGWQRLARQAAVATKLPVDQSLGHFPYPFGLPYVHAVYRAGGFAAVDGLYTSPPVSSAQVLRGYGAPDPGAGGWAEDLGADAVPLLPERYVLVDGDRLGAWLLEVFLARLLARAPPSPEVALMRAELAGLGTELRADRLSIFRDSETDRTGACWRLRMSSAGSAQAIARHLRGRGPWVPWTRDRDVILLAGEDPALTGLARPDLPFGPVPPPPAPPPAPLARLLQGCPERPR
jgi:hypothetical protein